MDVVEFAPRVKITVTCGCGETVFEGYDQIEEKYLFWCTHCDAYTEGKYPWRLGTQIVFMPGRYEETTSGRVWVPTDG